MTRVEPGRDSSAKVWSRGSSCCTAAACRTVCAGSTKCTCPHRPTHAVGSSASSTRSTGWPSDAAPSSSREITRASAPTVATRSATTVASLEDGTRAPGDRRRRGRRRGRGRGRGRGRRQQHCARQEQCRQYGEASEPRTGEEPAHFLLKQTLVTLGTAAIAHGRTSISLTARAVSCTSRGTPRSPSRRLDTLPRAAALRHAPGHEPSSRDGSSPRARPHQRPRRRPRPRRPAGRRRRTDHGRPGDRAAERLDADRSRLRRRAAHRDQHGREVGLPQRLRARHRRLREPGQHVADALRPDPVARSDRSGG